MYFSYFLPAVPFSFISLPFYEMPALTYFECHLLKQIHAYLDELAATYPNLVTVFSIGQSFEGRDLKMIKISSNPEANQKIWIDAGTNVKSGFGAPFMDSFDARPLRSFRACNNCLGMTFQKWFFFRNPRARVDFSGHGNLHHPRAGGELRSKQGNRRYF